MRSEETDRRKMSCREARLKMFAFCALIFTSSILITMIRDEEPESALNAPLLVVDNHGQEDGGMQRNCKVNEAEEEMSEEDKYDKRKQQEEARLRVVRTFVVLLSFCFVAVNVRIFSRQWRELLEGPPTLREQLERATPAHSSCLLEDLFAFPSSGVEFLSSYEDYESFKARHTNIFVLFFSSTMDEFVCRKMFAEWTQLGTFARKSFPHLGVGAMKVSGRELRHQVNVSFSLPMCVIRGEDGIEMGKILPLPSREDNPKRFLEFYNRTSYGIKMSFHELFIGFPPIKNPSHFTSLNSLDDYETCVAYPSAVVLAYHSELLFPLDYDNDITAKYLFGSWNDLATRVVDAKLDQSICVGVVDLDQNLAVAGKLGIKDLIGLVEKLHGGAERWGSYHLGSPLELIQRVVRDIDDQLLEDINESIERGNYTALKAD